jgi:hypothetical protein
MEVIYDKKTIHSSLRPNRRNDTAAYRNWLATIIVHPISKMIPDGKLYNIEEKLEYLWAYTGKIGHRVLDTSGININDDYNDFNVRWAEQNRENTTLKKQASIFNAIRLFLYVTGSGLFIYGKHLELKTRFSSK